MNMLNDGSVREAWRRWLRIVLAGAATIGLAGCGDPLASMTFYPVSGKVLLPDGKPLATGSVVFAATKSTLTSVAKLGSDGSFTFKGSKDGLPEDTYKVRIEVDDVGTGPIKAKPVRNRRAQVPFPEKYLDEDKSGLTATVKPGESNDFKFTLTK
jgi:hypothetical protein